MPDKERFRAKLVFRTLMAGQIETAEGMRNVVSFPTEIETPEELKKFALADMVGAVKADPPLSVQLFLILARATGLLVEVEGKKHRRALKRTEEKIEGGCGPVEIEEDDDAPE